MLTEMNTITISEFKDVIRHLVLGEHMMCFGWGASGIGKTEAADQVCTEEDVIPVDVRLGQYDSIDLRGMPKVDGNTTVWNLPATIPFKGNPNFPEGKRKLLILDEINTGTSPSVLAVAYQLLNERRVGEHELMDDVDILAMGNRESDRGAHTRMPAPLNNRGFHVEVITSIRDVTQHFTRLGLAPEYIAWLNFQKLEVLHTWDPDKPNTRVFATPRTHEKACRLYMSNRPDSVKWHGIAGWIGAGPQAQFKGFLDVWQQVLPFRQIVADPRGVPLPEEQSLLFATAVNVSGNMAVPNIPQVQQFLDRLDPEYAILAWQMAMSRDPNVCSTDEFIEFADKFRQSL